MKIITIYLLLLSFFLQDPIATFEIEAGGSDRGGLPIFLETDAELDPDEEYYLYSRKDGRTYPVQLMQDRLLLAMIDSFPAGAKAIFDLRKGQIEEKEDIPKISLKEAGEGIQILVEGKPLLLYRSQTAYPDQGPDYYKRSGFIHPLHSPNGAVLTDDFPVGHAHQHAIFNAWVNTTFKGKKVDFWNQQDELGTVKHVETLKAETGTLTAQVDVKISHISFEHGEVLEEKWQLTVYPVSDHFLFDLKSVQTNTSSDTLFLEEYIYGGMAFRGSKEWNREDTANFTAPWKILSSEGHDLTTANHTKAKWVNASGMVQGKEAGVTVFGFPDNFRFPQAIRVHPEMPYWVFSPVVDGPFFIAPGEKFVSRYRYLVHNGLPDQELFAKFQADIENPVQVRQLF